MINSKPNNLSNNSNSKGSLHHCPNHNPTPTSNHYSSQTHPKIPPSVRQRNSHTSKKNPLSPSSVPKSRPSPWRTLVNRRLKRKMKAKSCYPCPKTSRKPRQVSRSRIMRKNLLIRCRVPQRCHSPNLHKSPLWMLHLLRMRISPWFSHSPNLRNHNARTTHSWIPQNHPKPPCYSKSSWTTQNARVSTCFQPLPPNRNKRICPQSTTLPSTRTSTHRCARNLSLMSPPTAAVKCTAMCWGIRVWTTHSWTRVLRRRTMSVRCLDNSRTRFLVGRTRCSAQVDTIQATSTQVGSTVVASLLSCLKVTNQPSRLSKPRTRAQ